MAVPVGQMSNILSKTRLLCHVHSHQDCTASLKRLAQVKVAQIGMFFKTEVIVNVNHWGSGV